MNNFSGAVSVLCGIDNAAVLRLKYTRENLRPAYVERYNELKNLIDGMQSHKNYRQKFLKTQPPCLPHIGILLTDIIYIEDGNQDVIDGYLINFHKKRLIIKNVLSFNLMQTTPYNFSRVDRIQDFIQESINNLESVNDDILFEMSLQVEPRGWDGVTPISNNVSNN